MVCLLFRRTQPSPVCSKTNRTTCHKMPTFYISVSIHQDIIIITNTNFKSRKLGRISVSHMSTSRCSNINCSISSGGSSIGSSIGSSGGSSGGSSDSSRSSSIYIYIHAHIYRHAFSQIRIL